MKKIVILFFAYFICLTTSQESEVESNEDDGGNISGNPDEDLTTPQIIKRHGYASESHYVQTDDGYILTLHRIPSNKNGTKGHRPVFLQHGLLSSSADWVDLANLSLALLLSDNGYDVWLGNARGNFYSKAHVNFTIDSNNFWDFSWHEMGVYDLPAALNYVGDVTNQKGEIIYIGHSMGCSMFFAFASILPEMAKTVKLMIAMAPAVYMTHIRSPLKYLSPWINDIEWIDQHMGIKDFNPNTKILKFLTYECRRLSFGTEICENIIFSICGFDKDQFDADNLPVITSHTPSSTSTKCFLHFGQEINNDGNFQQFDYGESLNNIIYGRSTPLSYNLSNVGVPTFLMFGDNDWLANPIDVEKLAQNLPNNKGVYRVPLPSFNHVDFLYARDVKKLVYLPLLNYLQQYVNSQRSDENMINDPYVVLV